MTAKTNKSWLSPKYQLALDVVLLSLLCALDIRDLAVKIRWLGPEDSYSFSTTTTQRVEREPLAPTRNASLLEQRIHRDSGWHSFLQRCASMAAISADDQPFVHVLATNCDVGQVEQPVPIKQLVLASDLRVDSMAWAACTMLFHHRRPQICRSRLVQLFGRRYNMQARPSRMQVDSSSLGHLQPSSPERLGAYAAAPGTAAETELLALLSVISMSSPISKVVCVEAFPYHGPGHYTSSLFGCASPNRFVSSFVGHHATGFPQYQQNKAWLSSTGVHVLGMSYVIRENHRSVFTVREDDGDGDGEPEPMSKFTGMTLQHRTQLNFSCFGVLFTVAIVMDLVLLVINWFSVLEAIQQSLLITTPTSTGSSSSAASRALFGLEDRHAMLFAGLYRSTPVAALLTVSCGLHWVLLLPTGVVWAYSEAKAEQLHLLLTCLRFWVLILLTVNALWDTVAACCERRALRVVQTTYVTVSEVALLTGLVACLAQRPLLTITKHVSALTGQHLLDGSSFKDHWARANAFPSHPDAPLSASASPMLALYGPGVLVLVCSVLVIAVFVGCRFWYSRRMACSRRVASACLSRTSSVDTKSIVRPDPGDDASSSSSSPPDQMDADNEADGDRDLAGTDDSSSSPSKNRHRSSRAMALLAMISTRRRSSSSTTHDDHDDDPLHLPLETVLNVPIRAHSLVRSQRKMVRHVGEQCLLRAPLLLEHGLTTDAQGTGLVTRVGFLDVVQPFLRASEHAEPDSKGGRVRSNSNSSSSSENESVNEADGDGDGDGDSIIDWTPPPASHEATTSVASCSKGLMSSARKPMVSLR